MHIILDTNILRSDFSLRSGQFESLIDYSKKTGSIIVLPQLVLEELASLYKRSIIECYANATNAIKNLNSLLEKPVAELKYNLSCEALSEEYIKYVEHKLNAYCLSKPEYKDSYLKQLVHKSINRIKPFSDKGDGFRDGIIWLTIVDYITLNGFDDEYTFISNNTRDFSDFNGNRLHVDLLSDIVSSRTKFNYYKNLNAFLESHASDIDFISNDWICKNLDWELINLQALKMVEAIHYVYYEAYYKKTISDNNEKFNYEVLKASICRKLDAFYVNKSSTETFTIHSRLSGICEINFISDDKKIHIRTLTFGLEYQFTIIERIIISYQETFYPEETGFADVF